MTTIVHCSHMDIFQNLIVDLDHEGRYLFLNAIANQLRYPNSHTHYFSCALLYLFVEANSEAIQVFSHLLRLNEYYLNLNYIIRILKNISFQFCRNKLRVFYWSV